MGEVVSRNFLNLYQAKSGVMGGWVGRGSQEIFFSLNLYQAKSGVISFWVGGWLGGPKETFWSEFVSSQI